MACSSIEEKPVFSYFFINFSSRLAKLMNLNVWKTCVLAILLTISAFAHAQSESSSSSDATDNASKADEDREDPNLTMSPSRQLAIWFKRAAEAYAAENHEEWVIALENLHRLRPFNHDMMRQLVMGYALTDKPSEAFSMMLSMQQQGLAVEWEAIEEVESLRQYPLYAHLRDLMSEAAEPAGSAELMWEIGPDHPMPEALAHDRNTGRVFVGTVRDGSILVRGADESEFKVFAEPATTPGLKAIFDLLVDEKRGHLWVATGATGQFRHARPSDSGRTALLKLDLETGEKLGEFRVLPDGLPHLLGAITQASDGTIYAADGSSALIYRLGTDDERPEPLIGNQIFSSLRGITLSQDEQRLYVSDYDLGIFFFNLEENLEGYALGIPPTLNLGGIDGLYRWQNSLVIIQNGVTPERVLRLELDDSGTRVANIATIAKALPEFDIPTFGVIAGDELLFFASSHWDKVSGTGYPLNPPLPAIPVLRTPVDKASNIIPEEEMLERFRQQQGAGAAPEES